MGPLKFCAGVDGERCGRLFTAARDDRGRCPACRAKHNKRRYDDRRAQGYLTRQWTDVAKRFLEANPVWAYGAIYATSSERNAALDGWLWTHSHRRPHGALSHKPPIARLNELNNQLDLHLVLCRRGGTAKGDGRN